MTKPLKHLPPIGIGAFLMLYIYSATLYPGGSIMNTNSTGYDWFHNYWCDLMYKQSLNGDLNAARPYAVLGWGILCLSILAILLILIPKLFQNTKLRLGLQVCSVLAMSFGLLASTDNHDLFVALSFPFGATVVVCLSYAAIKSNSSFLKNSAWLVVVSLTASFIMYFTSLGLYWIGIIQKFALAVSFLWIIVFHYHFADK